MKCLCLNEWIGVPLNSPLVLMNSKKDASYKNQMDESKLLSIKNQLILDKIHRTFSTQKNEVWKSNF